jgi:hypothetical protein
MTPSICTHLRILLRFGPARRFLLLCDQRLLSSPTHHPRPLDHRTSIRLYPWYYPRSAHLDTQDADRNRTGLVKAAGTHRASSHPIAKQEPLVGYRYSHVCPLQLLETVQGPEGAVSVALQLGLNQAEANRP